MQTVASVALGAAVLIWWVSLVNYAARRCAAPKPNPLPKARLVRR
jgi:hypothetical protein